MIRVTVELIPGGGSTAKHLGTAIISNDLEDSLETDGRRGSYMVKLSKWGKPDCRVKSNVWRTGRVRNFPRQSRGPWDLLYRALHETVGDRNKAVLRGNA